MTLRCDNSVTLIISIIMKLMLSLVRIFKQNNVCKLYLHIEFDVLELVILGVIF